VLQNPETPAGYVVRYLEARRRYRESMHRGDRVLMSDVVAAQPLEAQITTPGPVRTVELTEGHLRGIVQQLAEEMAHGNALGEQLCAARRAPLDLGLPEDAQLRGEQLERLRAALGDAGQCPATGELADVTAGAVDAVAAENQKLRALLGAVLGLFREPDDQDAALVLGRVSSSLLEQWRAGLAELAPAPIHVTLPATASGAEPPAGDPAGGGAACALCGCTEDVACEGGCAWFPNRLGRDVCTACVVALTEDLVPRSPSSAAMAAAPSAMPVPEPVALVLGDQADAAAADGEAHR
jgi:hypothetical protein